MLFGFRAGPDADLGLADNDYAGTRRAWSLDPGTAPIGRVFPNGAAITPTMTPSAVVTKLQNAAAPVLAAGMWPYLSLKPDVAAAMAGQFDAHFEAVGRWAAGLKVPVYFSPWHEPENDAMAAAGSDYLGRARNFVTMFLRVYDAIHTGAGADRGSVLVGPCHMGYQWRPGSVTTADGPVAAAWRVPRANFYAIDLYTSNWSWDTAGEIRTRPDMARWMKTMQPPPGTVVIAERGITRNAPKEPDGPGAQAGILFDDAQYLTEINAHALLYWNSGGATDDSEYRLGQPGRGAFRLLALGATAPQAQVPPQAAGSQYQQGYAAGYADGRDVGWRAGLKDAAAWCATQANEGKPA